MAFPLLRDRFASYWRRWSPTEARLSSQPLLSDVELRALRLQAESLPASLLEFQRPAAHALIGDSLSTLRGRGFEFEENRAYQPGDEPRLLNWRLYARSGALFTKVFVEERKPQAFLLVDRRAAMRFATRHQLKAALAVKLAACHAWQARQQALAVGGLVLDEQAHWFAPAMGETAMQPLLQALTSACPPLDFDAGQPDLEQSLRLLLHRLPAGCFVLLVSDFHDLDVNRALPLLQELAARHSVRALQVLDPVEQALPAEGDYLIEDGVGLPPLRIDGGNAAQQAAYARAFAREQERLAQCFQSCAIPFRTCSTRDEPAACLVASDDSGTAH